MVLCCCLLFVWGVVCQCAVVTRLYVVVLSVLLCVCVCCVSYAVLCVSVCSCVRGHAATCCHAV